MKGILIALAVVVLAGTASAGNYPASGPVSFAGVNLPSGGPPVSRGATTTRLQPVVGSVQRTGLFAHPHTGRTKYTSTVYNPTLGQFGTQTFRR